MYTTKDYQHEINTNATWQKYASPANLKRITGFLQEVQWIPSSTTIDRAIAHLNLQRTDGRTAKDDARDIRAAAQRNYDAAAKQAELMPLTKQELDEFASLSQVELQKKYWGEDGKATDFFSIRYRAAARQHGFVIPPKPTQQAVDDGADVVMTPEIFRNMPSSELQLKLKDPRIKLKIMQMMKAGQI